MDLRKLLSILHGEWMDLEDSTFLDLIQKAPDSEVSRFYRGDDRTPEVIKEKGFVPFENAKEDFLGQSPNNEWFKDAIALDDKGYILAGEDMSTNIPGVFGAGDINHKPYRQITTAVSDGTIAALAAERWLRSRKK